MSTQFFAAIAEDAPGSELASRAASKDEAAMRAIMRRYNRRLYHLARSVLKDDGEAEDAVQQTYLKAFAERTGTWLSRIVINVALDARSRRRSIATEDVEGIVVAVSQGPAAVDPERSLAQREIRVLLERAIDKLPQAFRTVLIARAVEGLSIEETAALLNIRPETAKTRLHRARRLIRQMLSEEIGSVLTGVFPFDGWRCSQLSDRVIAAIAANAIKAEGGDLVADH